MSIIFSSVFSVIVLVAAFCNVDAEIVIAPLFGIFFGMKLKVKPVDQVDSKASGCAMSAGAQIKVTDDPLNKYLQPKALDDDDRERELNIATNQYNTFAVLTFLSLVALPALSSPRSSWMRTSYARP